MKSIEHMDDLISRQTAIDAFKPYADYESNRTNADWVRRIELVLHDLPSAQPVDKDINVSCKDAISRQAALDDVLANRQTERDTLITAVRTAFEEPKWIPCSERLPEKDGEYLVLYYTRSRYKPYVYDVGSFANDLYKIDDYDFFDKKGQKGWFYCDREYGFCEDNDVYAWMPLPEPFREEGE